MTNDRSDAPPADDEAEPGRGMGNILPDVFKRALLTGMGALFMTEEGIRNMVGEMKLPKDALAFLMSQAEKTRAEVVRVMSQEIRRFLESETLRREMVKVLSSVTLEVSAQIKLKPSGEPDITTKVSARRDKDKDGAEPEKS